MMSSTLVHAGLYRLTGALALCRNRDPHNRDRVSPQGDPAVLVIPRGGRIRDPYLVVLSGAGPGRQPGGMRPDVVDVHVRGHLHTAPGDGCAEVADVLVQRGRWRTWSSSRWRAHTFHRFPGCDIIVSSRRRGCLLAMRDGRSVVISGPASSRTAGTDWPAVYGSVLHCWASAGIPAGEAEGAVVIVGHSNPASRAEALAVVARADVRMDQWDGRHLLAISLRPMIPRRTTAGRER